MQDFDALQGKSIIQLREIAKSLGIRSTTQMKKDELIQAIIGPRSDEPVGPAGESPEPKPKRQRLLNNTPVRQSSAATDARETAEATANRNDGEETVQETENHGGAGPAKRYSNRRKQPARRFPQNRPTRQLLRKYPSQYNSPSSRSARSTRQGLRPSELPDPISHPPRTTNSGRPTVTLPLRKMPISVSWRAKAFWKSCPTVTVSSVRPTTTTLTPRTTST